MTLNENRIRELLDQATPGPWKLDPETDGIKNSAGNSVVRGDAYCDGDEVWLEWRFDADPALAALAPELARDWLRMRDHLDPVELTTEADFENAPEGTIVARNEEHPFVKNGPGGWWDTYSNMFDETELAGTSRKVLRWGWGE